MPPAPVAAGDIIQVIIKGEANGQTLLNVLYYKAKSGYPEDTYAEAMEELWAAIVVDDITSITDAMVPLMGNNTGINWVQCQRVYPTRDYYYRGAADLQGTHADDCDAPNVSAVITKRSERSGRGRSGSFHLGGIANTTYALGKITPAAQSLLVTLAAGIELVQQETTDGTGYEPGMFNPELGAGLNWSPIADTTVQETLRVMRRRTVGVGI